MTDHVLTEDERNEFHYTVGPYSDPVLGVEPGDTVGGRDRRRLRRRHRDRGGRPSEVLGDYLNPQNGPVAVDLVKDADLEWPRLGNDEFIVSIGSVRPMEDAARIAYADLVDWLVEEYGFDQWDLLVSHPGRDGPPRQHGRSELHRRRRDAPGVSLRRRWPDTELTRSKRRRFDAEHPQSTWR